RSANSAARASALKAMAINPVWPASTRPARGTLASPKRPMPNVTVQTTVEVIMNTAAAANTGRQRAVSQKSNGSGEASGRIVAQWLVGKANPTMVAALRATSAIAASANSTAFGRSRTARMSPMTNGATVTMPSASDANQWYHVVKTVAVEPWN